MNNKKVETNKKTSNEGSNKSKEIINKVKDVVVCFLKKHWDILLINIVVFILAVFIESQYIYNLKFLAWAFNLILFIVVPTALVCIKRDLKSKDVLISIPFLYILFLICLDYCTIRELYGISTLYNDTFPNYIDALMVVFIFSFFEYVTIVFANVIKKKIKK